MLGTKCRFIGRRGYFLSQVPGRSWNWEVREEDNFTDNYPQNQTLKTMKIYGQATASMQAGDWTRPYDWSALLSAFLNRPL